MANKDVIQSFYQAFANKDAEAMVACYHDQIVFKDPAFGELHGEDAKNMWRMLIEGGSDTTKITFSNVQDDAADWVADYVFGPKKRPIINRIHARFEFQDGKIIRHTDDFDLWKWSQQALGASGYLLGWSGFMRNKVQTMANARLKAYISKR